MDIFQTKEIHANLKDEMISLTNRVSGVGEAYLLSRFEIYNKVVCLRRNQKLLAFQLVQTFELGGEKYVYFGPLFSKMSCFLDLFMDYLLFVMGENKGRSIHLLAEIENPEVLLIFKALFEDQAFPKFQDCHVPDEIKKSLLVFSEQISHIENLDIQRLTSSSKDSLYQHRRAHVEIEQWLHSRNIDLSNGKKVVLYSTISHEPITRKEFKVQLERNRKQMEKWKERKKEVLGLFKGGIVSSV